MSDTWQPAILASAEHVMKFHTVSPHLHGFYTDRLTTKAGERIRIAPMMEAPSNALAINCSRFMLFGCTATTFFRVHPEDAARVFPESDPEYCTICEHTFLTD